MHLLCSARRVKRKMNEAAVGPNGGEEPEGQDAPWWKSVTFSDAALPESVRSDFPILFTKVHVAAGADEDGRKPLIYLDSAATSQKPTFVLGPNSFSGAPQLHFGGSIPTSRSLLGPQMRTTPNVYKRRWTLLRWSQSFQRTTFSLHCLSAVLF
mmetsp:Transcript_22021/g.45534  ORF Transcript_22021/g.45534 Transcript_22021/m.45534 type:complete len:154 (-) Transcript_22021:2614-3075(-)